MNLFNLATHSHFPSYLQEDKVKLGNTGWVHPHYTGGINNSQSFIISTLTLSILFFIFKPSLILNITQLLSLSLFYI